MARIIHGHPPRRTGRGRFWLVTLAALLTVIATASLGRWQLSRAAQKQALFDAVETRRSLPPLDDAAVLEKKDDPASLLHRPVTLHGRFLPAFTVFLDNRQMHGRPGFFVLTPLQLEPSHLAVLVQRGWSPRNFLDRAALPALSTPSGLVSVSGRIAPVPGKLFDFEGAERGRIRQNLDFADYRRETRLDLVQLSMLQTAAETADGPAASAPPDAAPTLLRDWPRAGSGVETHYGYAFQWFGLSVLVSCLYLWHQFIAPRRRIAPRITD